MEELNEERALKLNRVKAVEGERENLEGAKAEAEDFLTKEFQLCQKQKVLYMLARKDAVTAKQSHEAEVEQLEGKLKEQQDKMSSVGQKLEEFEAKCADTFTLLAVLALGCSLSICVLLAVGTMSSTKSTVLSQRSLQIQRPSSPRTSARM